MTKTNNSLAERISLHYPKLTASSRRIADYLQLNPEKILMLSTGEIAEVCLVSKASVSCFIRQLGYDDHLALRNELMTERDSGVPVLTSSIDDSVFHEELKSFEQLWSQLSEADHSDLIEQISTAKRVKIIGYRNSYPVAMHFRQQLMQCRKDVDLLPLPGQTLGEEITAIEDEDFVIIIGLRRRVKNFVDIIDQLSGQRVLLITDQSGQKYADRVSKVLICHMNNRLPLDSYAVPMSLVAYLVNKVYLYLDHEASKVTREISASYSKLNELE
ncbi:MurR/RpiR family transcriptional regulator [Psychromonas sp. KJ10-10]|uniref:MurR/RpiR family transcriptional regulator n=1 Tax=Psychromonas sp. KJ10-10 TaxID=3391823 RepID=UPI0039B676D4